MSKGEKTHCEYVSWNRFYSLCGILHGHIRKVGFQPDLIIGIARGGYMPARVLADFFGLMDLAAVKVEHYHGLRRSPQAIVRHPLVEDITGRRVLVVDDVSDSGDTFDVLFRHLRSNGEPAELRTAVLHHKQTSSYTPDFHARRVVKWRWIIYPWAATEDLRVLLADMTPRPQTVEHARRSLLSRHGLRVPGRVIETLSEVLDLESAES